VAGPVPSNPNRVPSASGAPRSNTASRWVIARVAVGIFFPQRPLLRLDSHGYSPAILDKIVTAGAELKSFVLAERMLAKLAEVRICERHVGRLTEAVGAELQALREQRVAALPLQALRDQQPGPAPPVVAVEVDGGRLHTRAEGRGRGVHEPHWKEDKIACLLTLASHEHATDPHPEVPACFLNRQRVARLVQEISNQRVAADEALVLPTAAPAPAVDEAASAAPPLPTTAPAPGGTTAALTGSPAEVEPWQPQRLVRTCVATLQDTDAFGKLVAAEAYQRRFYDASRRAFVADGQKYNWALHQRHFADFAPIADFVHVLSYVYAAAYALAGQAGWPTFERWLRSCWQGQITVVIDELAGWLQQQEPPVAGAPPPATGPREVARRSLGYLRNNASRMNYPRYRCLGLPCVSAWMESLVKEFNYRVKGSEKFWNAGRNAEAILQARAAVLSDDDRLSQHIAGRAGSPFRAYRRRPVAVAS
jgi:hypothetical protein